MRKDRIRLFKYSVIFVMITTAWWLLVAGGGASAVVSFFHNLEKTVAAQNVTSTDYRYSEEFEKTLNRYRTFQNLYQEEYSSAIPGLTATDVMGSISTQMVPQGICIAEDYMLVTAYDSSGANSVIYVLANQNPRERQLLTTIVLPDANHVGGIAYDGTRVWIAKSTTRKCSVIDYDMIEAAVASGKSSYFLEEYTQNVSCGAVASFITYYDNRIWVGTYSNRNSGMGTLRSYDIVEEEQLKLVKREEITIPGFANGVSFMENEGKTYMAVSTSQGRYFHSEIYFYQIAKDICSDGNLYYNYGSCKFPPMAEELVCDGENTYFLFESSATCYSTDKYTRCSYPVDRICALSTTELFWNNNGLAYVQVKDSLPLVQIMGIEDATYQDPRHYWRMYV
ncbi:hypothetical protein [Roseburia sp. 499]|uniref:hypothetical protein n=1 Tax=Roseburia sp. 499 TaxID=1261634 RepID=UPI0009528064|nr:hypothetical protein [Roseburia sp. 499]WVK68900.1 hypothetical protein BIV20_10965 [Roseburia sp. 499]